METRWSVRVAGSCSSATRLSLAIAVSIAVAGISSLWVVPARAQDLPLSELAPLVVVPGDEVSFIINDTVYGTYLYAAAAGPESRIEWWAYRDGALMFGGRQSDIVGVIAIGSGRWNLSFETEGRIALVHYLPEMCGWTVTTHDPGPIECPRIRIQERTAFDVTTWTLDRPYVLRVQGEVDASFFDEYLRPLGSGPEWRYDSEMRGIVSVTPRDGSANVTFSLAPAPTDAWPIVLVTLFASGTAALALVVAGRRWWRRRRRDSEANSTVHAAPRSPVKRR